MATNSANMGIETLLRPPWNFELDYDNAAGDVPIFFTWPQGSRPALGAPDLSVLDPDASTTPAAEGVSPVLAKFAPVPMGSTMSIAFPVVPNSTTGNNLAYVWRVVFRWRSAADYIRNTENGQAFLIGKSSFGAADERTELVPNRNIVVGGQRYVVPSISETIIYNSEPASEPIVPSLIKSDAVAIPSNVTTSNSPLYPGQFQEPVTVPDQYVRTMDYQQGVFDPSFSSAIPDAFNTQTATHVLRYLKSLGTEFAVECYKYLYVDPNDFQTYTPRDWDFGIDVNNLPTTNSEDYGFSYLFGIGALAVSGREIPEYSGVRVTVGNAPE